ncbi:MAG: aspartate aminotransferase family protein [Eggerthellaceae bacterium]|nr:aspartate aminotransferase family protein [Eggerthellaceae bacterium]
MKKYESYAEEERKHLVDVYKRFPVCFESGKGVRLYDTEGKEYLDFASGIATNVLGYAHEEFNEAIKSQLDKITHTSNLFYNTQTTAAAKALKKISGMDKIFFTNCGTEAIETALKTVRAYGYNKGTGRYEIIAMKNSFHGRSMGALSVTENPNYREPFLPLIPGIKFAKYNNLKSVEEYIGRRTCAIILELIQGEGGICPAEPEFIKGIRKLCNENGILLIIDEIQAGMGRTGNWYCYQHYDVKPDIMTTAKAVGNGIPCAACAMTDDVASNALGPGDHGTTFGGNPLACTAITTTIDIYERHDLVNNAKKVGQYLAEGLDKIVNDYVHIIERRGFGLMQGLLMDIPAAEIISACLERGLALIAAQTHMLRFLPPLIISKDDVDEMVKKLRDALDASIS